MHSTNNHTFQMLIQFTVSNYRSILHPCSLTLKASGIGDEPQDNYVLKNKKIKVLKTAAIYGANSSGKTNIVRALATMSHHVISSVKLNDGEPLDFEPFALLVNNTEPSLFEAVFILGNKTYRYGFELNTSSIISEWLYQSSIGSSRQTPLFIRNEEGIAVNEKKFPEGIDKEGNTNQNRLFISLCAQLGGVISQQIVEWFRTGINTISGNNSQDYLNYTKFMLHKHIDGCNEALHFFQTLHLGFSKLETKEIEFDSTQLPPEIPNELKAQLTKKLQGSKSIELYSQHNIYDNNGKVAKQQSFDVATMESDGTNKLIQLSGPIFDTLACGATLVIDELDSKMHPLISEYIVKLFNSPKTNPKHAQLIFTTHDTHLLTSKLLRRDQIWFTEKNSAEQTDLYNMMDIKLPDGTPPRNDANYEKNYILGRYGAIPFIV